MHRNFISNCIKFEVEHKYAYATTNEFSFCGVDFIFKSGVLSWKIKDDIITRWKKTATEGSTPRHALQLFGYVNRVTYIRLATNYHHRTSIRYVARLSRMCAKKELAWNEVHPLAKDAYNLLATTIKDLDFRWTCSIPIIINHPILLATDASGGSKGQFGHIGFVLLHKPPGSPHWVELRRGSKQRTEMRTIDYGETLALQWALTQIVPDLVESMDCCIAAIDNTTTSYALLRGAAYSEQVDDLIQASLDILLKFFEPHRIAVNDIASADNVADVLTRSQDCENEDYATRLASTIRRGEVSLHNMQMSLRWASRLDTL